MLKERILLIELDNGDIGSGSCTAVNSMSLSGLRTSVVKNSITLQS
jgi:hypothetical protein